jgi:hypothetical protein
LVGAGGGGVGGGGGFTDEGDGGGGGFGGGGSGAGNGGFGGGGGGDSSNGSSGGFGGGNAGNGLGGGGGGAGLGGAIFNMGATGIAGSGVVKMTNCTLTANSALGGAGSYTGHGGSGYGGALFNLDGSVTLNDVTVAANRVARGHERGNGKADGGAVYNLAYGNSIANGLAVSAKVTLYNSILSDTNSGLHDLVSNAINGTNTNTASINGSTNLVESNKLYNSRIAPHVITVTLDPQLGKLQYNGGLTDTMAINSNSPAHKAGNANVGNVPSTDQRGAGYPRIVNGHLDLGAFEVQPPGTRHQHSQAHPRRPGFGLAAARPIGALLVAKSDVEAVAAGGQGRLPG